MPFRLAMGGARLDGRGRRAERARSGGVNRRRRCTAWVYPIGRAFYPAGFCTLQEVGLAMINAVRQGYPKQILEVEDIVRLANANQ